MKCPKCRRKSGDDWSQCHGSCPMPGSPFYNAEIVNVQKPFGYYWELCRGNEVVSTGFQRTPLQPDRTPPPDSSFELKITPLFEIDCPRAERDDELIPNQATKG
jgi:hypothetical protein